MKKDERRAFFRTGLSSLYLPFYDLLCARLGSDWQPYYGFRSFAEQGVLYNKGRVTPPIGPDHRITNAQAGYSPHNYGCASDWTLFNGETPIWPDLKDPRWGEYVFAVNSVGLRWGGDWNQNTRTDDEKFRDFPHNELAIDCGWGHICQIHTAQGSRAAQEHIERNLHGKSNAV